MGGGRRRPQEESLWVWMLVRESNLPRIPDHSLRVSGGERTFQVSPWLALSRTGIDPGKQPETC